MLDCGEWSCNSRGCFRLLDCMLSTNNDSSGSITNISVIGVSPSFAMKRNERDQVNAIRLIFLLPPSPSPTPTLQHLPLTSTTHNQKATSFPSFFYEIFSVPHAEFVANVEGAIGFVCMCSEGRAVKNRRKSIRLERDKRIAQGRVESVKDREEGN